MATHTDALASVYARSLFELAREAGGESKISEVADELEQIVELATEDRKFGELLSSPIVESQRRAEALRRIFTNRITDLTLRFLLVLNEKGRLRHLPAIVSAFDHLVQEAYGRVEVDVYTAAPLANEQLNSVRERIRQALGRDPVLHPYTDPNMIGGLKLRIGDQLIDGSVASQLRRMKRELQSSGASRVREQIRKFIQEG